MYMPLQEGTVFISVSFSAAAFWQRETTENIKVAIDFFYQGPLHVVLEKEVFDILGQLNEMRVDVSKRTIAPPSR